MSWPRAEDDEDSAGTFTRFRPSSRSSEGDFERFAKSIDRSLAVFSLGFCKKREGALFLDAREDAGQRKLYDQVERLTVMRRSTDSRKASSSARDFRISASLEMLIRIVKAFFAMG